MCQRGGKEFRPKIPILDGLDSSHIIRLLSRQEQKQFCQCDARLKLLLWEANTVLKLLSCRMCSYVQFSASLRTNVLVFFFSKEACRGTVEEITNSEAQIGQGSRKVHASCGGLSRANWLAVH